MNPTNQYKIVILEADLQRRNYLKAIISSWGFAPYCFEKETICLDNLTVLAPDLAVYGKPVLEKLFRFVSSLRLISKQIPLLILSNSRAVGDYVQTNGFAPVVLLSENANPVEIKRMIDENIKNLPENEMSSDAPLIIGNSPEIIKIKKMIPELSRSNETVFLLGEPGTGKELIAKSIFWGSGRKKYPFIKVNAAAIIPAATAGGGAGILTESVLSEDHFSLNALAGVGAATVFLDRIESLSPDLQGTLLHLLEGCRIDSFESVAKVSKDIRFIAAADTALEPLVGRGGFRRDLYYRLNVLSVAIPPLRDRREDIPLLADFFADKFCLKSGKGCFEISPRVKTILCRYHWPGNVGELENMVRDMVVSGDENNIIEILGRHCKVGKHRGMADFIEDFIHSDILDLNKCSYDAEKISMKEISRLNKFKTEGELIHKALEFTSWNRKRTAKLLSISYKSLLNKIKAYGLERY